MSDRLPGSSYDNPIWHRGFRIWAAADANCNPIVFWCHEECDLADLYDRRHGDAPTLQQARAAIDDFMNDQAEIAAQREKPSATICGIYQLMQALGSGGMK